ncbi:MAG: ABC transporter ATP-binding protein [Candidatus Woesearchaeota archaeon]
MHALEIKNVSKHFELNGKRFHALKDVSFDIEEGEIFGILGPNGAGKTTLLNTVTNMLIADKGSIKMFGKTLDEDKSILERINFVSGLSRFHWNLNGKQILNFYGMLYDVPAAERQKRIEYLTGILELGDFMDQNFDRLSSGQRTRLVLAKALINSPKMLLLDEPTIGLDPDIAIKVRRLIKTVNRERKMTIVLTSHYMTEVEQLCDRIAFLHKGKLLDVGEVDKLKSRQFDVYKVMIEVDAVKNVAELKKMGFRIQGKKIFISINNDSTVSDVLAKLGNAGYKILDIEIKKPSLEDYFVRMLK